MFLKEKFAIWAENWLLNIKKRFSRTLKEKPKTKTKTAAIISHGWGQDDLMDEDSKNSKKKK